MVTVSAFLMAISVFLASIITPLYQAFWFNHGTGNGLFVMLVVASYLTGRVGIAGFEANMVQFSLDQLMDHSSRHLSFYLHMLVWIRQIGVVIITIPLSLLDCDVILHRTEFRGVFQFVPLVIFVFLIITPLIILIKKRNNFFRELGSMHPYRMVVKVISYALKNKHPRQRRSAFFYYYGLNPGRLDFAKVHYGGPFSTEDVENVKTLVQMLGVFLCVGPVFILTMSTSFFMYQHFVHHFINGSFISENCPAFWSLLGSGNADNITTFLLYPVYTFIIFVVLKNIPRILLRMLVGLIMITSCLIYALSIEVAGHYAARNKNGDSVVYKCALAVHNVDHSDKNSLDIHWAVLIFPTVLYGLASPIVYTTIFEFISAQSPKSMTGLLIGTFYFIEGIFKLLGIVLAVPFSVGKLWKKEGTVNSTGLYEYFQEDWPLELTLEYDDIDDNFTNQTSAVIYSFTSMACEMWYLVVTIAFGILGIFLFSIAARRYKYRKREENPFPQSDIEEIVTRGIEQENQSLMDVASVEVEGRGLLYDS